MKHGSRYTICHPSPIFYCEDWMDGLARYDHIKHTEPEPESDTDAEDDA